MKGIRIITLSIMVLSLFLMAYGCEKKAGTSGDNKLVARINNYEMTIEEFEDEARMVSSEYPPSDPDKAKNELLEEMITKNILIQEAQRQNFDKDKPFMKEIQSYWEQALLKLLLKQKTKELLRNISVEEKEVMAEYERLVKEEGKHMESYEKMTPEIRNEIRDKKIREALDKWITELKDKADIKIYKENLREIELK